MALTPLDLQVFSDTEKSIGEAATTIGTTIALQQANEAVQQVKNSTLDDAAQRNALMEISRRATLALSQAGATPDSVKQIANAISPALRQPQTAEEAALSYDPEIQRRGLDLLGLQAELKKQQKSIKNFDDFKTRSTFIKDFRSYKPNQDALESIQAADDAIAILDDPNIDTPQAINMIVKRLIRANGESRISDIDFAYGMPGQSIPAKITRSFLTNIFNKASSGDKEELRTILNRTRESASQNLNQRLMGHAKALANTSLDTTPQQAAQILRQSLGVKEDSIITEIRRNKRTGKLMRIRRRGNQVFDQVPVEGE